MGLNVKAALGVCMSFICGTCWMLNQVGPPLKELPSPLLNSPGRIGAVARPAGLAERMMRGGGSVDVAGRFAAASAVRVSERPRAARVVWAAYRENPQRVEGAERMSLPPLSMGTEESPVCEAVRPKQSGDFGAATRESSDAPRRPAAPKTYRVRWGDTLVKIARREWNSRERKYVDLLVAANPQLAERRNEIVAGEILTIPDAGDAERIAMLLAAGRRKAARDKAATRVYTVRKNDSLVRIARRFLQDERRWLEIKRLNRLRDADHLIPGTRIKLPMESSSG